MNVFQKISKPQMSHSIMGITPEMAKEMLDESNFSNRNIRNGVVNRYAKMMLDGDWKLSPEPIVFATNGRLLNGQHRLSAVVRSGVSCQFSVMTGVEESVFEVLDRGATRNASDALGLNKTLTEAGRLLSVLQSRSSQYVNDFNTKRMSLLIKDLHDDLLEFCPTRAKIFSTAAFRVGCVANVMNGAGKDYAFTLYRDLVLGNVANLPPIGRAAVRSVLNGSIASGGSRGGGQQIALLRSAWMLFDPSKRNSEILRRSNAENFNEIILKAVGCE
jgi:hypothetical protein